MIRMLTEKDERETQAYAAEVEMVGTEPKEAEAGFFWNQQFQNELEEELDDDYDDL